MDHAITVGDLVYSVLVIGGVAAVLRGLWIFTCFVHPKD